MSDHLPEDLVRAQDIDALLHALCDDPCKDACQTVRDGCSCAMIRAIVGNLQMELRGAIDWRDRWIANSIVEGVMGKRRDD